MRKNKNFILILAASIVVSVGILSLLFNIFEKKQEAKYSFYKVKQISDDNENAKDWGANFPFQYEDYLKTTDQIRTRFGGSEAFPRTPSKADPRSVVAQSKIEEDTRLKKMWEGYAFSIDYREKRGHAYMLLDQIHTQRVTKVKQPGTCINCHASTYVTWKKLGNGDLFKGFEILNQMPYDEVKLHVKNPISCIDCHDPANMQLRVTRPAFIEGIKAYKEHQGIKNFKVNSMASRQEMRTFVCAQCHVEYYFREKDKRLVYPWANGIKADEIYGYYEKINFKDWVHKSTKAPMLKAQHPEFELWSQGIHARSGVSCVDCHMPFKKVGSMKITDHHVRSPLLNINRSCRTCHGADTKELKSRAEEIQFKQHELENIAKNALMDLIDDIKNYGKKDMALKKAQAFHRKASWYLDYIISENSTGFHAPQEAARIIVLSIDASRKGQNALRKN